MNHSAIPNPLAGTPFDLPEAISREKKVSVVFLREVLATMPDLKAPARHAGALASKADMYLSLQTRFQRLAAREGPDRELWQRITSAMDRGDLRDAEAFLWIAKEGYLDSAASLTGTAGVPCEQARATLIKAAEYCSQCAAIAELRPDTAGWRQAAAYYAEAARITAVMDPCLARYYRRKQAALLQAFGNQHMDLQAIRDAFAIMEDLLQNQDSVEYCIFSRANALTSLGNALLDLAEQHGGSRHLEHAASAFQAALEEYSRAEAPLSWAAGQENLGKAFLRLGESEKDTRNFRKAAIAFKKALREYTRERTPLIWARIKKKYGDALLAIGKRENSARRLQRAAGAFEEALREIRYDCAPILWAQTQHSLGVALKLLGQRTGDGDAVARAAEAFGSALKVFAEMRLSPQWLRKLEHMEDAWGISENSDSGEDADGSPWQVALSG